MVPRLSNLGTTGLVKRWEEELLSLPEIDQMAVVVDKYTDKISPLHLSDLLPAWGEKVPSEEVNESDIGPVSPDVEQVEIESKPLAISNGGPLREIPNTLSEALQQAAAQKSDRVLGMWRNYL